MLVDNRLFSLYSTTDSASLLACIININSSLTVAGSTLTDYATVIQETTARSNNDFRYLLSHSRQ